MVEYIDKYKKYNKWIKDQQESWLYDYDFLQMRFSLLIVDSYGFWLRKLLVFIIGVYKKCNEKYKFYLNLYLFI